MTTANSTSAVNKNILEDRDKMGYDPFYPDSSSYDP